MGWVSVSASASVIVSLCIRLMVSASVCVSVWVRASASAWVRAIAHPLQVTDALRQVSVVKSEAFHALWWRIRVRVRVKVEVSE